LRAPDRDPTFLDHWRVVWAARWVIITMTVFSAALGFAVARLMPKLYIARATVLPPKESGGASASMSLTNMVTSMLGGGRDGGGFNLPGLSMSAASVTTNQDVFVAVLGSRTMREEVLAHFAKTDPRVASKVGAIRPLIDAREKGIISLSVEATEGPLASDLANYYFEALDKLLERYAEQAIRRQEAVFSAQLERAAREVEAAEKKLLDFQTEKRILAVGGARSETGTSTAAALRANIQTLELQREVNRMKYTDQHPIMRELDKQISELKRQYSKNLFGTAMELPPEEAGIKGFRREFFVSAERMTPVQFAFLKLARNLQIQEGFYTAAIQGLQQIKYGEGASYGRVVVLDPAIPPGAPAKPNVMLVVAGATGGVFIAAVILVFFLEYLRRVRALERRLASKGEWRGNGRTGVEVDHVPAGANGPAVLPTVPS
jgi:uncharacterized protein involved in exopolysaccharide biosynthesis